MSVYTVHFTWKEKEMKLRAKSLDMTHPYFISIKDLIMPEKSALLINPADDEVRKLFGESHHIMLPIASVFLIEENPENDADIRPFRLEKDEP